MREIKSKIRTVPNWPKEGVMFRDFTLLLQDPEGLQDCINNFVERYKDMNIDYVAGIEARGFIIGGAIAHNLGKGFIPIRKKGKLPSETISQEYDLEYGTDTIEIHKDAIEAGKNVLIVDDLIATGGTALAAGKLVEKLGAKVVEFGFVIDLPDLKGGIKLKEAGFPYFTQTKFEGN